MTQQNNNGRKKRNIVLAFFRKLIKLLFNKIFYVAAAVLIQAGWLLILYLRLVQYSDYIAWTIRFLAVILVLAIVNQKINPSYKLAWTMLILASPVFGVMIYLLFGESRVAKKMEHRFAEIQKELSEYMKEEPEAVQELNLQKDVAVQSSYIRDFAGFPVHRNTEAQYFQVGDDMFPVLLKNLEQAQHYIFIEYFIINDGVMWETILRILEKKAMQGVDVRLVYDGFGCYTSLPSKYQQHLKEKNIKSVVFNPVRPILNIIQNNRDHRKLCIIDGYVGFTGGINLSDEYINAKERFGHWKDTAVMLKGEAVWNMTAMFLTMWRVITGEEAEDYHRYLPHTYHPEAFHGEGFVQPFSDSPLDHETVGENVYLNILGHAKEYVYICTPYLIIDNEMMTALCLAAKNGVDVRIMTPGIPDKKMVFLLTQSYYEQLLECGVKIYEYQPGFLHSKSFVCDDQLAVVGTINLDYRSLYLHFEDGAWIYRNPVVMDIKSDFMTTLEHCKAVDVEFCRKRHIVVRIIQNILRLVAPML